jgi:hypothetical protein
MASDPSVPDASAIAEIIDPKDLVFGRTVVPVINRNKAHKKSKLRELFILQSDQPV